MLGSCALGFMDPVLAPYLHTRYGLGVGVAGLFFMLPAVVYILTAIVAGWLIDAFGTATTPQQEVRLKLTTTGGFGLLVLGYFFLAPPFAPALLERLPILTVALVGIGVGIGFTVLPSLSDLQGIAERRMQPVAAAAPRTQSSPRPPRPRHLYPNPVPSSRDLLAPLLALPRPGTCACSRWWAHGRHCPNGATPPPGRRTSQSWQPLLLRSPACGLLSMRLDRR